VLVTESAEATGLTQRQDRRAIRLASNAMRRIHQNKTTALIVPSR